jgi:hypothetical protein
LADRQFVLSAYGSLEIDREELAGYAEQRFSLYLTRLTRDITRDEFGQFVDIVYSTWLTTETDEEERAEVARAIVKEADIDIFEGCDRASGDPVGLFFLVSWQTSPVSHTFFWQTKRKRLKAILEV